MQARFARTFSHYNVSFAVEEAPTNSHPRHMLCLNNKQTGRPYMANRLSSYNRMRPELARNVTTPLDTCKQCTIQTVPQAPTLEEGMHFQT